MFIKIKKIIAKMKNTIHISKIRNQKIFKMSSKNRHHKKQLWKIKINRENKIEKIFVIENAIKMNILKIITMTKSIKTKTIRQWCAEIAINQNTLNSNVKHRWKLSNKNSRKKIKKLRRNYNRNCSICQSTIIATFVCSDAVIFERQINYISNND